MRSYVSSGVVKRWVAAAAALVVVVVLAGCTVARPPGAAPLRYRDQVFSGVTTTRDIQYGSAIPQAATTPIALKLDLYQPTGDTLTQRPAAVFVHGGGYSGGDKGGGPSADFANIFAKLGYVTVSINYRLISQGCTGSNITPACFQAALDAQHDAQAAVRWLRANAATYRIDPTRIAIGGESAGAITATAVGVHSEDPGTSGNPGPSSSVSGFMSISGGLPGAAFAGSGDAPGVLFHGTADGTVPYQWSVDTSTALLKAGVVAVLETQEGAGHVPYGQYHQLFLDQTDYFFYDVLDLAHAQGQSAAAARAFTARAAKLRKKHPKYAKQLERRRKTFRRFALR